MDLSWTPTTARSSCGWWRPWPGDPVLLGAFARGEDIHRRTASEVLGGRTWKRPSPADQRSAAKGRELRPAVRRRAPTDPLREPGHQASRRPRPSSSATSSACPRWRSGSRAPRPGPWREGLRGRPWPRAAHSGSSRPRASRPQPPPAPKAAEHVAPGTAADLMPAGPWSRLPPVPGGRRGLESRLLLQVHDELLVEAPPAEVARLAPVVRETMEERCHSTSR